MQQRRQQGGGWRPHGRAPLPRLPSRLPPAARLRLRGWSRAGRGLRVALAPEGGSEGPRRVEPGVRGCTKGREAGPGPL